MKMKALACTAMSVMLFVLPNMSSADIVQRIWWNPSIPQPGTTDPFQGQSTDTLLAEAGDLTYSGYTRVGPPGFSMVFGGVPTAFSETHYIEFSIKPAAGIQLDVNDLLLQAANHNGHGVSTNHMVLRTELDNFTNNIAAQAGPSTLNGNTGKPRLFDLSSLPALTEETSFRLYAFGYTGNFSIVGSAVTNGYALWFDNVDASPLVPEPASLSLLALGGLAMLKRRRKPRV
ncbi:PEP-CTERM sorting domain-containing protein [Poriferisphaera sp. WC338]|uniref:PEP-CTERM sorting domain-containing protein n=1 Tax=Poriferisphaera sp. WC338 TaxID=3425129 RepID=UPI003D81B17A